MLIASRFYPHVIKLGVKATIFNRVAVHRSINGWNEPHSDRTWTITHLVSGWAIENRIPSRKVAMSYAKILDTFPELDYHAHVVRRSLRMRRIVEFIPRAEGTF